MSEVKYVLFYTNSADLKYANLCHEQAYVTPAKVRSLLFVPPSSLVGSYYLHHHTHVPYFYIMIYHVMTNAL